jgi:hypothetical protein
MILRGRRGLGSRVKIRAAILRGNAERLLGARTEDSEPMPIVQGHCDPRFEPVREVFEKRLESRQEVGAAIAFTLEGELVVDLWGGSADAARTRPW